ncbi:MAG: autotransporter-associated beta strand repeat-containing protein [Verrucomicrobiota bacterium]
MKLIQRILVIDKKFQCGFLLLTMLFAGSWLQAATNTFFGTGANGNIWNRAQNWTPNGIPGANDTAAFGLTSGSVTPLVDVPSAISNLVFNLGASAYALGGTSVLTVGNGIVNNGSLLQIINTSLALAGAQTWNANMGNLTFGGNINNAGFPLTITGAASTSVGGIISGSGSVTKTGNGTLTLSAANTFSGGMTINGGSVLVNNTTGSATGSGSVVVNSGTLRGNGIITGGLTLNTPGRISPGSATGSQRVATLTTGNEIWNGGAAMTFEVKDAASTAGTGWDLISINGTLDLSALNSGNQFSIDLTSISGNNPGNAANFNPNSTYQWTFLTTTGGIIGFQESAFNITTNGFSNPVNGNSQFLISLVDGGNGLAITYVPEPSTVALAILGAVVLAGQSFRRRHKK